MGGLSTFSLFFTAFFGGRVRVISDYYGSTRRPHFQGKYLGSSVGIPKVFVLIGTPHKTIVRKNDFDFDYAYVSQFGL